MRTVICQKVFVWQYLDTRQCIGRQILCRSKPISYDVNVKNQVYFCHASQLLQKSTGHQDLSDTQKEQLLNINPPLRH